MRPESFALRHGSPVATSLSAATPAAAESGFALYVPGWRIFGLPGHAIKEVLEPRHPISVRGDAEQTFVIITAGCLEKGAQVKQRRRQYGPLGQKQSNQQAADAAVAVEKGMDGFELVVRERDLYQRWQGTVMQECLPLLQARHHFRGAAEEYTSPLPAYSPADRSNFVTGEIHQVALSYHDPYLITLHAFHELDAKIKEIHLESALNHAPLQQHNLKPRPHPGWVPRDWPTPVPREFQLRTYQATVDTIVR